MGYVIGKKRYFTTKATVTLPDEEGNAVDHLVTAKFRIASTDEFEAAGVNRAGFSDRDLVRVVLVDVPDLTLQDEEGNERDATQEERVAAALTDPPLIRALSIAYNNAIAGRVARKN